MKPEGIAPGPHGCPSQKHLTTWDATASFHVAVFFSTRCAGWQFDEWSGCFAAHEARSTGYRQLDIEGRGARVKMFG